MSTPRLSIILVCPRGAPDLALPLIGLRRQTIAHEIELILVGRKGVVTDELLRRISGMHSVRAVEVDHILSRGEAAAAAVGAARAPFIGLHENHTCMEAQGYEKLLAAMTPQTGAIAPTFYCLNVETPWAATTYVLTHGHCSDPVDETPRGQLVLHQGIYPRERLIDRADLLAHESDLHSELAAEGWDLRFCGDTVLWHIESGHRRMAIRLGFLIGRMFGWSRRKTLGPLQRLLRTALMPVIAAITLRRYMRTMAAMSSLEGRRRQMLPRIAAISVAFAAGECRGYWDRTRPFPAWADQHEFEMQERLASTKPAHWYLREALRHAKAGTLDGEPEGNVATSASG